MKSEDLKKALWMLRGFADALETDLARRIGDEEAAQYCMSLHLALSELDGLRRNLDRLDALDMDYPGHRQNWRPYAEV